jgi:hypothetical protein
MVLDGAENPLDIQACYCILMCYVYLRVKRSRPAPAGPARGKNETGSGVSRAGDRG